MCEGWSVVATHLALVEARDDNVAFVVADLVRAAALRLDGPVVQVGHGQQPEDLAQLRVADHHVDVLSVADQYFDQRGRSVDDERRVVGRVGDLDELDVGRVEVAKLREDLFGDFGDVRRVPVLIAVVLPRDELQHEGVGRAVRHAWFGLPKGDHLGCVSGSCSLFFARLMLFALLAFVVLFVLCVLCTL